jgi:hypothetical protein
MRQHSQSKILPAMPTLTIPKVMVPQNGRPSTKYQLDENRNPSCRVKNKNRGMEGVHTFFDERHKAARPSDMQSSAACEKTIATGMIEYTVKSKIISR